VLATLLCNGEEVRCAAHKESAAQVAGQLATQPVDPMRSAAFRTGWRKAKLASKSASLGSLSRWTAGCPGNLLRSDVA